MKRTLCTLPIAIAITAAVPGAQVRDPPPDQPVQTFRTATDAVLVDVSVRLDGRPVTDLRVEDFVLTDNGVRQRIESIESTAVPIDLTLIVDLSGNSHRRWTTAPARAERDAGLRRELDGVRALLRPEDRIRVLAIDRHVQLLTPMSPATTPLTFRSYESDGLAALYDTIAAAMLHPTEPARRHVVIAQTKGEDTISSIDARALQSIAERSDTLFHLVLMETALDNDDAAAGFQCEYMGICWPTRQFWSPFRRRLVNVVHGLTPDGTALATGAEATGGGLHNASGLSVPTLTSTFTRTFQDFRSGYVLRYTPRGVARAGWHTIEVKVPSRNYVVRSRRGYAIEVDGPAPGGTAGSTPADMTTLRGLIDAYEARSYEAVVEGLRRVKDPTRLIREFQDRGNPWPAAPRREAVFALELADTVVFSPREEIRKEGYALLERFTRLVRHPLEPDTFERYWHFAVLTLLEGSLRPGVTRTFVDRALQRFPDEPRFILSRAIAADVAWLTTRSASSPTSADEPSVDASTVREYYEAAIQLPEVATEARIRYAHFLLRSGQSRLALAQLDLAGKGAIADVHLRYLHALFKGHVLDALDQQADAAAAYRAALEIVPRAQSARVALMNTLLLLGDRAGAEALAETIQAELEPPLDPWWMYWQGQFRLYGAAMARVREMSR